MLELILENLIRLAKPTGYFLLSKWIWLVIKLTRLNHSIFYLNPEQILTVESTPDTIITLLNGIKLVVKESPEVIRQSFIEYHRQVSWMPPDESQQHS